MTIAHPHDLVLDRLLDAPRDKLFRCWTEPELLKQWFVPAPWTIAEAQVDPRPGGSSFITMRDPDGNEYPNKGVYLDVVPNEKIVFTDAYTEGWTPAEKPFFTGIVTFAEEGGKTRYVATARHWRKEDRDDHEKMGFQEGWSKCADQLEELARRI